MYCIHLECRMHKDSLQTALQVGAVQEMHTTKPSYTLKLTNGTRCSVTFKRYASNRRKYNM